MDPWSVESIAAGLERLLRSPQRRAELGTLGQTRAAQFSWSATAARVLERLEDAAADNRFGNRDATR